MFIYKYILNIDTFIYVFLRQSFYVAQAGEHWCNLDSLQPPSPGFKRILLPQCPE